MPSKIISGLEILRQHFHFEWLGLLSGDLAVDLHEQEGGDSGRWVGALAECTCRVQTAGLHLGSVIERPWLAPGGPF